MYQQCNKKPAQPEEMRKQVWTKFQLYYHILWSTFKCVWTHTGGLKHTQLYARWKQH